MSKITVEIATYKCLCVYSAKKRGGGGGGGVFLLHSVEKLMTSLFSEKNVMIDLPS